MNTEKTENKLRQLFGELRAQDSQRVPSFKAVTRASPSAISTAWMLSSWSRFAAGIATVVLLIAGIALAAFHLHTLSAEREIQQWARLSNWEAPTDTLLGISDMPWGKTITTPSDSLINNTTESPDTTIRKL
ncbi:MAG TPA: hypothetical protein VN578_10230 [Candidatus Binatia bacterium]|jgi:hypothetical protein|nr:hypothetical protein [Candidatus Binatia bacterium]